MASVLLIPLAVLLMISSRFAAIFGWCDGSSSSCSVSQVCCRNQCVYGTSCLYRSCSMDSDCSDGEVCCSSECRTEYDCSGQSCSMDSDCSSSQYCCNGVCRYGYDCYGRSCSRSNACGVGLDCCDGVCDFCDDDSGLTIALVVLGSLVALFFLVMLIYYCHRRSRFGRAGGVVIARQSQVPSTHSVIHAPPQVSRQGYPYQSLPQYDQCQNAAPPPYSGGMATGSDLPPPYSPPTQGTAEGGHTSHPTYGAIPSTWSLCVRRKKSN